jgi:hypothetical protein
MINLCYINKEYLLSLKPKCFNLNLMLLIAIVTLIFSSFLFKVSQIYLTKGQYVCKDNCYVEAYASDEIVNKIINLGNVIIENQAVKYDNLEINNNLVKYEIIDNNLIEGKIYDVKIYYNEERLFNKVINYLFK